MVHLMRDGESEFRMENMSAVKMEVEDSLEEEHGPFHKRPKQQSLGMSGFALLASEFDPLDEPSPLGLSLKKSPSLLELIQKKLSQSNSPEVGSQDHGKKESKAGAASGEKLKASNFPGSVLRIGTWEYKSRYEGDLVAKCYFAKHKLVWEVLDGGLKNKIEIQWSDIMALKANYPDDGPETLDVVLARQPLFFRETNPQPRKHTLWQATSDFTCGQASLHRHHHLESPQGLLGKHIEKLTQCDPRLNYLSQQGEIILDSPCFEPKISALTEQHEHNNEFDLNRERSPSVFSLQDTASSSKAQSSSSNNDLDGLSRHSESYPRETPSPSSARDRPAVEDIKDGGIEQLKELSNWDQIRVPRLHTSMSMSDLVSHLEHRMAEQGTCNRPTLSSDDWQSLQILDDINRCLFSDIQHLPNSDEKSLLTRVNSLCCLLQKDEPAGSNEQLKSDYSTDLSLVQVREDESNAENKAEQNCSILDDDGADISDRRQASSMSRKDSVGDLLLNLPRIASLPQFLFNIPEDFENQAR